MKGYNMTTTTIRLNADKRKSLVNVYEDFIRKQPSKVRQAYDDAKANFDELYPKIWQLVEGIVRQYQPQCDVDTIKSMRAKYSDNGGRLHDDNCFYFINPTTERDSYGDERTSENCIHVEMNLDRNFGYAYYHDELKSKGLDPNYQYRWKGERRNPSYYDAESKVDQYLGFDRSQNDDSTDKPRYREQWSKTIPVIGTDYCHSRNFKVSDVDHSVLNSFIIAREKVVQTHEAMFDNFETKIEKLRQGLKTYTKYSQAKELFDKLGIPLNESMISDQSSMALSVFSPTNLADMLTDQDDEFESRAEKIAHFKSLQQQTVN